MTAEMNRRVLVIDDNQDVRADFAKILASEAEAPSFSEARSAFLGGPAEPASTSVPTFELTEASQGLEGLERAREAFEAGAPFAMAFVDVRMPPGLDGVETIAKLWELQEDLQVVICTAFADYSFEEIIEKLGSSDNLLILKKPFEPVEVRQLASALTEKWNTMQRERERLRQLHEAEREAREYAVSLADTNRALEHANDQAETASRAKSEFLANMSHEIRTPMGALLGNLDLFLDEIEAGPEQARLVDSIKSSGQHLLEIVNDILDLSRIEAGRLPVHARDIELPGFLTDLRDQLAGQAREKGLELAVELDPAVPPTFRSDPLRVRQVLLNLLGNAIKFTERGTVTLLAGPPAEGADQVAFAVRDTGPGIPAEAIPSLFDAFTQLDTSLTRAAGGTGLGLAISERLAANLHGRVEVESEVGAGSTFTLVLPVSIDATGTDATPPAATEKAPDPGSSDLSCRVLLVEDVPVNQVLVSTFLRKAGATVEIAENGLAGCEAFEREALSGTPFDLVLMDMQMPVLNGYEATARLRAAGHRVPIVALTAQAMADDREKCLAAGCTEYLTKPVDRRLLVEKCARLVGRAQSDAA